MALGLLSAVLSPPASAQYTVDWWSVDGGGGQSTDGVYTVSGTAGQPDAGQMSGGNYTVSGGFWSLLTVVPTPGAPSLAVTRTTTNTVVISWPSPAAGWNLEQNTNLTSATWVTPAESVTDDGSTKSIIVNPAAGNRFYRLHKP
jgi:hypothetical protein